VRVAILDDYFDTLRTLACFALLDGHDVTVWTDHVQDVDTLADRLGDVDALVLIRERTTVSAELLERLPRLALISQRSVYPHVDVAACTRQGVVLCSDLHTATASRSTAELTWALILASARRLPQQVASMRAGQWQSGIGRTLEGQRLGVYGYGRIGRIVAQYGLAFGMSVVTWGSERGRARERDEAVELAENREAFFAECDVVSVHVRLVDATRGVITGADLARMKPTATFVNTSRSGLVEPGALVAALRAGRPGAAALDVFDVEPLRDTADPLLGMDNVICTPHVGYVTREEWEVQFADIFAQINAYAAGAPINVVNPEALAHPRRGAAAD